MDWTLQPRSYYQAIRPNWYNVAYRRTGVYKGMGWLGQQPVSTDVLFNLPMTGPYTSNPLTTSAALVPGSVLQPATPSLTSYMPWIIAGFLVLLLAGGRR